MRRFHTPILAGVWLLLNVLPIDPLAAQQLPQRPPAPLLPVDLLPSSPASATWRLAGDAWVDPDASGPLRVTDGDDILVFHARPGNHDLTTEWMHGDLDLEMEVMLGHGAASGVLLQGLYEVQLADSWGKAQATYSDMGGVDAPLRNNSKPGATNGAGVPPLTNAARAPGLWQQLQVRFRAPRFDTNGKRIESARFLEVRLNGVVVQQDVQLAGPTQAAARSTESAEGPLVFQAAAGSGAFRNIRVKRYDRSAPLLEDIRYAVYEGEFRRLADVSAAEPVRTGTTDRLGLHPVRRGNDFAVTYEAIFPAGARGTYQFGLLCEGGCRLEIGDRLVLGPEEAGNGWHMESGEVDLEEGRHPIRLSYYKSHRWWRPRLELMVEGPGFEQSPLYEEVPGRGRTINPIVVRPGTSPRLLRSFMHHGDEKRTHVISVGSPSGTHFSYDLASGSLLQVWRGAFLDVTQMWHERGEPQVASPLGASIVLPRTTLIVQGDEGGPTADPIALSYAGYALDDLGYPSFEYRGDSFLLTDKIAPDASEPDLVRTIRAEGLTGPVDAWLRVAAAEEIHPIGEATYAIGGFQYYVVLQTAADDAVIVRHRNGEQELMLPLPTDGSDASFIVRW